jgi:hypothetical protein
VLSLTPRNRFSRANVANAAGWAKSTTLRSTPGRYREVEIFSTSWVPQNKGMKTRQLSALWMAGRSHWRQFIWAWLLPVLLYLTFVAESVFGPVLFKYTSWILLGEFLALVLAGTFASAPYRRREVGKSAALFWVFVVPILIFLFFSILPFKFAVTITGVPTSAT